MKSTAATILIVLTTFLNTSFTFDNQWPSEYGEAKIDANYCVSIDTSKPLQSFYKLDIAHLNFDNEADAQKVFGAISNNYLTYRADFTNKVAYLKIHSERTKDSQDVIWWNNYIQSLCK